MFFHAGSLGISGERYEPAAIGRGIVDANGNANVVPRADENSVAFARTFAEVLKIVYLGGDSFLGNGGFFPQGMYGRIR